MKFKDRLKSIIIGTYKSMKRFPVTLFSSVGVAVMLIIINEMQPIRNTNLEEMLKKITMMFALGIPLSLCIKLLLEKESRLNIFKTILYYAAGALVLILYYYFLLDKFNMVSTTRYIGINLALYLGFLFIPYLPAKEKFEMYIIKILAGFFTTVFYSIVLYGGLSAILFTIDKLLGVHVDGKVYYYTGLFVGLLFAPSYFLSGIPQKNQEVSDNYPKLLKVLFLYIVMPLLTVYTTILYIYFIKIIITRQWPVGLVSHLVLWYSVIVAAVLFLITPIRKESKWSEKFMLWLPKVIIPILIMMFVSMGIRINAYGITENRYYVVILGIWVSGMMIYFSLTKKLKNIVLPVTLSIIVLISVFGPLSSYSISKRSQNNRLEKILIRNDMLKDGEIQPASASISNEDKNEISRILDYFKTDHSLREVKTLTNNFKMEDMDKVFGFSYQALQNISTDGYFNFNKNGSENVIDISGYDYLLDSRSQYNSKHTKSDIDAVYTPESGTVKIYYKGSSVYTMDLKLLAKDLIKKYGAGVEKGNMVSAEDMTLTGENEKIKAKLVCVFLSGRNPMSSDNIQLDGVEYFICVKVK